MKKLAYLYAALAALLVIGCGSPQPDEAKLHKDLAGPPSMASVGQRQHKGARERAPDGGVPGGQPGATK